MVAIYFDLLLMCIPEWRDAMKKAATTCSYPDRWCLPVLAFALPSFNKNNQRQPTTHKPAVTYETHSPNKPNSELIPSYMTDRRM
jgi:hypothetical protein